MQHVVADQQVETFVGVEHGIAEELHAARKCEHREEQRGVIRGCAQRAHQSLRQVKIDDIA